MDANEEILRKYLKQIGDSVAPEDAISLFTRIREQVKALENRRLRSRRSLMIVVISIIFGMGILFTVPAVRAQVEVIWERLGLAFVDTSLFNTNTGETEPSNREVLEVTKVAPPRRLNIEEINEQAPFEVLTPQWLPDNLVFVGGQIEKLAEGTQVELWFYPEGQSPDQDSSYLLIRIGPGSPFLVPANREQHIDINGNPASYIHGGWDDEGRGDPSTALGNGSNKMLWNDEIDDAYLTGKLGGQPYLMFAHELGLRLDEMKKIAESMK